MNMRSQCASLTVAAILGACVAVSDDPGLALDGRDLSGAIGNARVDGFPTPQHEVAYSHADGVFGMSLSTAANRVDFVANERGPDNKTHYEWTMHADTAYPVLAVCGRHANQFYVCGQAANGLQLERWVLTPWQTGAYYTERRSSTAPLGTSVTPYRTQLRYRGPFVTPAQRTPPVLVRTPISAPSLPGTVVELEADPEDRYLTFRSLDAQGRSSVYQFDLSSGTTALLASSTSTPALAAAACMYFMDSTELGRLLKIETNGLDIVYLVDEKNDGLFESSLVLRIGEENYNALPEATLLRYP